MTDEHLVVRMIIIVVLVGSILLILFGITNIDKVIARGIYCIFPFMAGHLMSKDENE